MKSFPKRVQCDEKFQPTSQLMTDQAAKAGLGKGTSLRDSLNHCYRNPSTLEVELSSVSQTDSFRHSRRSNFMNPGLSAISICETTFCRSNLKPPIAKSAAGQTQLSRKAPKHLSSQCPWQQSGTGLPGRPLTLWVVSFGELVRTGVSKSRSGQNKGSQKKTTLDVNDILEDGGGGSHRS